MWEDFDSSYLREDSLEKLKSSVATLARECNIELRILGGLLKFTPIGVYRNVLLELEQPNFENTTVIYKHRNSTLTSEYKGKAVSEKWVINFLKHNALEAKHLIEQMKQNENNSKKPKMNIELPKQHIFPQRTNKENKKYGYSEKKTICYVCNGDGGAAGQCYKCGGSGWA
jgi:hypothetical protein